jgi:hypothetical protein
MDENKGLLSEANFQGLSLVLLGLILVGIFVIICLQRNSFVETPRPPVLNFPDPTRDPVIRNAITTPTQLTPAQVKFLQSRHGTVINFPNWGPPGDQPPLRPMPNEKNWWGFRPS